MLPHRALPPANGFGYPVHRAGQGVLTYFVIGFVIGVVTCIPIGMANVAVIDAAYRHNLSRAIAVGLGGAIADGIYASLGIFGVGPFLARHPEIPPYLYLISGIVLVIYGLLTARAKPSIPSLQVPSDAPVPTRSQHVSTGLLMGLLITLLNPSAVVTWVVIVGSYAAGVGTDDGIACVIGVVLGSVLWFGVVAYAADHGKRVLNDKAIWMTRIMGILVAGYGVFSLFRAGKAWLT